MFFIRKFLENKKFSKKSLTKISVLETENEKVFSRRRRAQKIENLQPSPPIGKDFFNSRRRRAKKVENLQPSPPIGKDFLTAAAEEGKKLKIYSRHHRSTKIFLTAAAERDIGLHL